MRVLLRIFRKCRVELILLLCGIVLVVLFVQTMDNTGDQNRGYYEAAKELQNTADEIGFSDFVLEDYPVAFWDGTYDYVYDKNGVSRRKGVLSTYAATAYPVDDHFEVIVPEYESMSELTNLLGTAAESSLESAYTENMYLAAIWHEAFHAYQLSNYAIMGERVTAESYLVQQEDEGETVSADEIILDEIDGDAEIKEMLSEEIKILYTIAGMTDAEEMAVAVGEYESLRSERLAKMSKDAAEAEFYYELTEGTAYYVESKVFLSLEGEDAYLDYYLNADAEYSGGSTKFYHTGMIKCLILDELCPNWKENFDFEEDLDSLISDCLSERNEATDSEYHAG